GGNGVRSQQEQIFMIPDAAFIAASSANTRSFFSALGARRSNLKQLGTVTAGTLKPIIGSTSGAFFGIPDATPVLDKVSYAVNSDAGAGNPENNYSMVNRGDYNFSDKTSLYLRYAYFNQTLFDGTNNNSPYAGYDTGLLQKNHNGQLSLTHVFTPSLVSDSKVVFNRFFNLQPLGTVPVSPTLFFTGATPMSIQGALVVGPGYSAQT